MKKSFLALAIVSSLSTTSMSQPRLAATCAQGGEQFGTVLKYTGGNTTLDGVYQLHGSPGNNPMHSQLIPVGSKLYGLTSSGGIYGSGTMFEYDPLTNILVKKYDFSPATGSIPKGSLLLASNGKLYGLTHEGGANNLGVIFEFDISTGTYTKKIDLTYNGGQNPYGSLTEATTGKLYGMTYLGGMYGYGVIFEYNISTNIYTKKFDLYQLAGAHPKGSLALASNGRLYGLTQAGGLNNKGVLFEYIPSTNSFTKKIDLTVTGGSEPLGTLLQVPGGNLYGLTLTGGTNNKGTIFEYNSSTNVYTKKFDMDFNSGYNPNANLIRASNGKFYGTAENGGALGWGALFEYDYINNVYTKKHDYDPATGSDPLGTLYQATNGKLYGLSGGGGSSGYGVIFEYDISANSYAMKFDFTATDGDQPVGSLFEGSNGKLYGMTYFGGVGSNGTIFEYDYNGNTYQTKYLFTNSWGVQGYFTEAPNGKLYGNTRHGGSGNYGTIFEYDYLSNTHSIKHNFTLANAIEGAGPIGSLTLASNGKFYGLTDDGGAVGFRGVLFEYDYITNTYTKKVDFLDSLNGEHPTGFLTEAGNGKLYGLTNIGGVVFQGNYRGLLFEYDFNANIFTKKYDFMLADGCWPVGGLVLASNGKLYGATSGGGINNLGVIFEYDPNTNQYTKRYDFNQVDGNHVSQSMFKASNDKLYGLTAYGGSDSAGVIFEYDYTSNTYTKLIDLEASTTGNLPQSMFMEVQCVAPFISASGPTTFCQGGSVILTSSGNGTGHQWYRDGIIIPGATNASYQATIAGKYTIKEDVCSATLASNEIKVKVPCRRKHDAEERTGMFGDDNELMNYLIYHDPATDIVIIKSEEAPGEYCEISIYDAVGKILMTEKVIHDGKAITKEFSVSSYDHGMYFVKIISGNEQIVRKFLK